MSFRDFFGIPCKIDWIVSMNRSPITALFDWFRIASASTLNIKRIGLDGIRRFTGIEISCWNGDNN